MTIKNLFRVKSLIRVFAVAIAAAILSACDADSVEKVNDILTCEKLDKRHYFSQTLKEGGRGASGIAYRRWSLEFDNGILHMLQSDFGLTGTYTCDEGVVSVQMQDNSEKILAFSDDLTSVDFNPLGGKPVTYILAPGPTGETDWCGDVQGKHYVTEDIQTTEVDAIEFVPPFIKFGQDQSVEYTFGSDAITVGIYNCDLGTLYLHEDKDDISPLPVTVQEEGKRLVINKGDTIYRFVEESSNNECAMIDGPPVCAVEKIKVDCVTEPCPIGQYKSFENQCFSDLAKAEVAFTGKCGELEGKFVYEKPQACDLNYDPVCGIEPRKTVCKTEPCPIGVYKTYSNACHVDLHGGIFYKKGECGDLEGRPAFDPDNPVFCTKEYVPVCGIVTKDIVCVTTPCPNQFYQTFGNECEAKVAGAVIHSRDECGELEGQPVGKPQACTKELRPVCAADKSIEPCTSLPCPTLTYKTYQNPCLAEKAGAQILERQACTKQQEGNAVDEIPGACIALYDPVCGNDKAKQMIQCLVAPCPNHEYSTYSNSCVAGNALAGFIHKGECGPLEGKRNLGAPPVQMVDNDKLAKWPELMFKDPKIDGDRLEVTLGYSGCSPHHHDLLIGGAFLESFPVQVEFRFAPIVVQHCEAFFETRFAYDLTPLKIAYQNAYRTKGGEIIIPGIGRYSF